MSLHTAFHLDWLRDLAMTLKISRKEKRFKSGLIIVKSLKWCLTVSNLPYRQTIKFSKKNTKWCQWSYLDAGHFQSYLILNTTKRLNRFNCCPHKTDFSRHFWKLRNLPTEGGNRCCSNKKFACLKLFLLFLWWILIPWDV